MLTFRSHECKIQCEKFEKFSSRKAGYIDRTYAKIPISKLPNHLNNSLLGNRGHLGSRYLILSIKNDDFLLIDQRKCQKGRFKYIYTRGIQPYR